MWFGETLDPVVVRHASRASACDVFITVGTSAVVYPAAGFLTAARQYGAFTVEINAEATPATSAVDLAVRGAAEEVLPEIQRLIMSM